jgi:hypothetical protein
MAQYTTNLGGGCMQGKLFTGAAPRGLAVRMASLALTAVIIGCGAADAGGARHEPSPTLPRLQHDALPAPDAGRAVDHDMLADRIYLLTQPAAIQVLQRMATGWTAVMEFGRAGSGPGELTGATGVSHSGDGLVVTHPGRLQFFSGTGEYMGSRTMTLPCAMMRPVAAAAATGFLVAGSCVRSGYGTDTVNAVLAWAADSTTFAVLAEDLVFTRDGRAGSIFGARSMLTAGSGNMHAFGAGTTNCVWRVDDTGGAPGTARLCPAVAQLYSADPPPGLERRLRRGVSGMQLSWPATLPVFVDRLVTRHGIVLIRPFHADSVVLQIAGEAYGDLAVAPLDGFVGCKAAGCLWLLENGAVPRIILLDAARVDDLVTGRGD